MSDTPPDPAPLLHATALLERFGGHLTEWQREMFLALVGPGGVSSRLVLGRGRRAGWTVLMATVENALRSREFTIVGPSGALSRMRDELSAWVQRVNAVGAES